MEIEINGTTEVFPLYRDGEAHLLSKLRHWNNFAPETPLTITIAKPLDPDSLRATTSDVADSNDLFGRA